MPTPSSSRPSKEKGRNGKLAEKAKSFHGKPPGLAAPTSIPRPRTLPNLYSGRGAPAGEWAGPPRLTKLLLNVTVQRSLGAVQVVMSPEDSVGDLVREAVRVYGKEGRRPLLLSTDPACFGLHYSQFSLESIEVKSGESVKCEPGIDKYLHLSQASLGEVKKDKGNDSVVISVKVDDRKLVLGTLSSEKCAQISYDLVFEKEFELSHNWKNGSVYFCGYRTMAMDEDDESGAFMDSESESDEEIPQLIENGKPEVKEEKSKPSAEKSKPKPDSLASKPKAKVSEPNKADKPKEDDGDDEDDEDESEDESDDEDMVDAGDDSDDEDDEDEDDEESSDEDEATPKKDEKGKKRPAETETKTPISGKKAKLATPSAEKTGANGKKGGQAVTPAKQVGKTPASNDKGKQQTPKSGGQVSCKSCSKKFNSDVALQAHTKAKHSAGK